MSNQFENVLEVRCYAMQRQYEEKLKEMKEDLYEDIEEGYKRRTFCPRAEKKRR